MKNNISILMVFAVVVWGGMSGCGSETDTGMKNALDSGSVTGDINEADGFNVPQGSLAINDEVVSINQTDVTLKLTASDAVGVTGYYLSSQSVSPSISDSNWKSVTSTTSFSKQVSETISAVEKSHSFFAWYRDAAGGTSTQASASIIYDVTAPANPSVSIDGGSSSTTNTVVSLTLTASDSVGVAAYYVSETNSDPTTTATGWNSVTSSTAYSATVNFTLSSANSEGNHSRTVYVWFKDTAGNVSASASDEITLIIADTTAPTSPSISINSGASTTTSSSITLSLSASDNVGVTGYYLSTSSSTPSSTTSGWINITSTTSYSASVNYTLSTTGTTTLYVWFKDAAGNMSSSASANITYSVDSSSADLTLTLVTSWGSLGTNSEQFSNPQYTHVFNSKIYVPDQGLNSLSNNRVTIYDLNGNLSSSINMSNYGTTHVSDICFDSSSRIYVTTLNSKIVNINLNDYSDNYTINTKDDSGNTYSGYLYCAINSNNIFVLADTQKKVFKHSLSNFQSSTTDNATTSWSSGGTGSGQYMGYGSIIADDNYVYISSRDGSGITKFDTSGNVIKYNGSPKIRQLYFNPTNSSEIFGWDQSDNKFKIFDTSLNELKTNAQSYYSGITAGDHGLSADSNGYVYISGYHNDYKVSKYQLTRN